jgi:hypothetical protein
MSLAAGLEADGGIFSVYCVGIGGDAQDLTTSEQISTISHDWIEGTGDYDPAGDSACYVWPADQETWGDDNNENSDRYGPIDALDVVNGNGSSILNSQPVWEFRTDQWTDIELDAELVQGLIDGSQYGIAVWRDTTGVNLDLASRERDGGAFAAKLTVQATPSAVSPGGKAASTWGILKSMR